MGSLRDGGDGEGRNWEPYIPVKVTVLLATCLASPPSPVSVISLVGRPLVSAGAGGGVEASGCWKFIFLYCQAKVLKVREWPGSGPIPPSCVYLQCPLTASGELEGTLGVRKRVESLLYDCIRQIFLLDKGPAPLRPSHK